MKMFIIGLLCLFAVNVNAQNQEIEQLISVQNILISEMPNICSVDNSLEDHNNNGDLSHQLSSDIVSNKSQNLMRSAKKSQKLEAYSITINVLHGFTFHVADYIDGTRVVTALDGDLRGYQAIGANGVQVTSSTAVEWHSNYFVHYYPNGEVTTHQKKQTLKIYNTAVN